MDDDSYGPTNVDRAGWALAALNTFAALTHHREDEQTVTLDDLADPAIAGEYIGDLICDLLHLAAQTGNDPDALIEAGRGHFDAETDTGYDADYIARLAPSHHYVCESEECDDQLKLTWRTEGGERYCADHFPYRDDGERDALDAAASQRES